MNTSRILKLVICILSISILITPISYAQSTWYVNVAVGNDDIGTGSVVEPYKSISKAISVSASGDTISIAAGIYNQATTGAVSEDSVGITGALSLTFVATTYDGSDTVTITNGFNMNSSGTVSLGAVGKCFNLGTTATALQVQKGTLNILSKLYTAGNMNISSDGAVTFSNDVFSGGNITILSSNVNFNGTLNLVGSSNQTITTPTAGTTVDNITINKTSGSRTVMITGGDLTCNGLVTFNNGLLLTGVSNALVLTNQVGISTAAGGSGFVRTLATGGKSHVVGNVRQNLKYDPQIAFARNEFPVGDTANYRPAVLTFHTVGLTSGGKYGITATVSHTLTGPTGVAGLPIADAITLCDPITRYPSLSWSIKTDSSLGATPFNMELTAAGFSSTEIDLNEVGLNMVKIIRRAGGPNDQQNIWSLFGTRDLYDNMVISGVPTVIAVGAVGGLSSSGSIFTYGMKAQGFCCIPIISGVVKYNNTAGFSIKNVNFAFTSCDMKAEPKSDSSGKYEIHIHSPGSVRIAVSKVGIWGGVNATDALVVARHSAGISLLTGIKLRAGDVNRSSTVNNTDALLIVRRVIGLDTSFLAGDWIFVPPQLDTTVTYGTTIINVTGLTVGDVNASYRPPTGTVFP